MRKKIAILGLCFLFAFSACGPNLPPDIAVVYHELPARIDFNYHVRPILSDKCFACHGPDEENRQANLRLDTPEGAYRELAESAGKYAIMPGKSGKSELVKRILSEDVEAMMPPPESHLSLNHREIAILTKWIEQGAEYKPHWSFIKPEKKALPNSSNVGWGQNPIDNFILNRLEENKLTPSEKASRATLIRRLSFDLIGLPPSLEEIKKFVNDDSSNAYEKLVDRLLASPAYGERMAMDWMDVARYADSDGYLDDKHRDFTPWRDWVIEAFNDNMSYDQFVRWQLAGDLLPDKSKESILATAFNRLHRKNSEAGIVFEEFRVEHVADRTLTLGKAFMGLSVECARCHDHKYDPISQQDYYKLFGFFNSTHEIGTAVYGPDQTPGPALLLSTQEQDEILAFIEKKISKKEQELMVVQDAERTAYQQWASTSSNAINSLQTNRSRGLIAYYPFDQFTRKNDSWYLTLDKTGKHKPAEVKEPIIKPGRKNKSVFLGGYTQIGLPKKIGWFDRADPFSVSLSLFPDTIYEDVGIFFHTEELRLGLKGYSLFLEDNRLKFIISHSWPNNAIQVRTRTALVPKEWRDITITYDGSSKASGIKIYLDGVQVDLEIDHDNLYKSITYEYDIHTYGYAGFTLGERNKIDLFKRGGIDELKIYDRSLTALEVLFDRNPGQVKLLVNKLDDETNQQLLQEYYFQYHHKASSLILDSLQYHRVQLSNHLDSIPEIMVMGDLPAPRPTFVLNRGMYNDPGEEVQPGVPDQILPFGEDWPSNRLGLVNWLFDPDHPLTARVFVNRIWQMHFGQGIVKTSDDFGSQGDLPSHPALLDWLAITFIESGWDIKRLHKLIVMSATYQQSSKLNELLLEVDPQNVLLARGPSFRLPAEMIRDNALAISGLLVRETGGASAYPYQPEGLWDEISNKHWRYPYLQEPGEGLYRRSLYTIWKRTSPPPSLLIFDAPDRSQCTVNRRPTSTPLQALVLLNDPQYLEAARVLAENIISAIAGNRKDQLTTAFNLITGRIPDEFEVDKLNEFYEAEIKRFSEEQEAALAYLSIGEMETNETLDAVQTASLATVISGIMNTSEAYTRR